MFSLTLIVIRIVSWCCIIAIAIRCLIVCWTVAILVIIRSILITVVVITCIKIRIHVIKSYNFNLPGLCRAKTIVKLIFFKSRLEWNNTSKNTKKYEDFLRPVCSTYLPVRLHRRDDHIDYRIDWLLVANLENFVVMT